MGNWRTVQIQGTCHATEAAKLKQELSVDLSVLDTDQYIGPLSFTRTGSICGLNAWPRSNMDCLGNLFERDYSVESVVLHLKRLVNVAPSLTIKVHCGGEYEDRKCVSTITVEGGAVTLGEPEIAELPEFSEAMLEQNMMMALLRSRW